MAEGESVAMIGSTRLPASRAYLLSRHRRRFAADAPEAFGGADEEAAVADGGGGVDGGVEFGRGEALELGSRLDDDEITLLATTEDFAVGSNRAAEEFGAALDAFHTLFVNDLAGLEFHAAKDAAIAEKGTCVRR